VVMYLRPFHLDLGAWSPWGRALRNRRRLRDELLERIRLCRQGCVADGAALARIVRDSDGLSDEEILSETMALLLFGHDTAAATLAWAFAHIHRDPRIAARVCEEARSVNPATRPADPERHVYIEASLKESMRLSPVVVHLTRVARRDLVIAGYEVPAGSRLFPCAYLAQRNPEVFPEPGAFRPERFLGGRSYEGSYFPFGFGSRTCIGRHLAMRQMILVTSTIARLADLALAPGRDVAPVRRLVLVLPRGGTKMVLQRVRDAA